MCTFVCVVLMVAWKLRLLATRREAGGQGIIFKFNFFSFFQMFSDSNLFLNIFHKLDKFIVSRIDSVTNVSR